MRIMEHPSLRNLKFDKLSPQRPHDERHAIVHPGELVHLVNVLINRSHADAKQASSCLDGPAIAEQAQDF